MCLNINVRSVCMCKMITVREANIGHDIDIFVLNSIFVYGRTVGTTGIGNVKVFFSKCYCITSLLDTAMSPSIFLYFRFHSSALLFCFVEGAIRGLCVESETGRASCRIRSLFGPFGHNGMKAWITHGHGISYQFSNQFLFYYYLSCDVDQCNQTLNVEYCIVRW